MQKQERLSLICEEMSRVDGRTPSHLCSSEKHEKMAASPFRFFRGAAQIYYADLASGLLAPPRAFAAPQLHTAVMGDCHLSNFGFLTESGSATDWVVFVPNDFDDACHGPAIWDITRFATSLLLAVEYCGGLVNGEYESEEVEDAASLVAPTQRDGEEAIAAFLAAYRKTCLRIVEKPQRRMSALHKFHKGHVLRKPWKKARKRVAGGKHFKEKSSLAKAVDLSGKRLRFKQNPERFEPLDKPLRREIRQIFRPYVDDAILDVVRRKGAGTGSLNVDRFYLLVGPQGYQGCDDLHLCHIVEVKQQRPASALYHFPEINPQNHLNAAHLTIDCQRLVQRAPDLVLDEVMWQGVYWLVRSRHHARVGLDPEDIALAKEVKSAARQLTEYATACGQALALAHARSDRRSTRFEAAMAELLENHQAALIDCANGYAQRTREDWRLLKEMLAATKIGAE
jgi:uncharacterized protein (DUF2252 family)